MNNMKYQRDVLLEVIKKNREEHVKVFDEAQDGYRKAVIAALEQNLSDAKAGRRIQTVVDLIPPVNQTKEYDRAIRQLEMTIDTNIELTERDFSQYVMDEWNWSRQFFLSNSAYSATAADSLSARSYD